MCELNLNKDIITLLKRVDLFTEKKICVRLGFETMKCKMMHDSYVKIDTFFIYRRTCQSNL